MADGLHVVADIHRLTPDKHGFQVHEKGDCSVADATSASGRFNLGNVPHRAPDAQKQQVGDLGNVESDGSGNVTLNVVNHDMSLSGLHSIVGRVVIVHAQADDLVSRLVGNAGARCEAEGRANRVWLLSPRARLFAALDLRSA